MTRVPLPGATGAFGSRLAEGPVHAGIGVAAVARRRRAFGLAPPRRLTPAGAARERLDAEGRVAFDVPVAVPARGRLTRRRGWPAPIPPPSAGPAPGRW